MAIGGQFDRYFDSVMQMLKSAASMSIKWDVVPDDYDQVEWLLKLRSSIFEAYTGIFQARSIHPNDDLTVGAQLHASAANRLHCLLSFFSSARA